MKKLLRRIGASVLLVGLLMSLTETVLAPPANAVVTGMLAMWVHGTAVQVEYPERTDLIFRRAFHTRIEGQVSTSNWFHFPVPTPVVGTYVVNAGGLHTAFRRYRLDKVFVNFRTGSVDARVTNVHVYDGSKKIASFDNLNLYGEQSMCEFTLPGSPEVFQGICVTVGVTFGSNLRWIELQSVGADFFLQE